MNKEYTIFTTSEDDFTALRVIKFSKMMLPILKLVYEGVTNREDIYAQIQERMKLSDKNIEIHKSKKQDEIIDTKYKEFEYSGLWSIYHLRKNGLIKDVRRGYFEIAEKGKELIKDVGLDKGDYITTEEEEKIINNIINKTKELIARNDIESEEKTEAVLDTSQMSAEDKYDYYSNLGRIKFLTFHQSYSYEEFVEGITARTEGSGICYYLKDGVFKELCKKALAIAIENYNNSKEEINEDLLLFQKEKEGENLHDFIDYTSKKENKILRKDVFKNSPKVVLIIDEINRGNISKILGELITLLEEDKRLGEKNEIIVTLPYSKKKFCVPPNLYIISTMNTADRSIAQMDIALRRRFDFILIPPKLELLREITIKGINMEKLLSKLNERIRVILDEDHLIGHSYFMELENLEQLQHAWYNKIIPLLEEYFYEDYEKLKLVLGSKFVEKEEVKKDDLFEEDGDLKEYVYEIRRYDQEEDESLFLEALKNIISPQRKNQNE